MTDLTGVAVGAGVGGPRSGLIVALFPRVLVDAVVVAKTVLGALLVARELVLELVGTAVVGTGVNGSVNCKRRKNIRNRHIKR